MEKLSTLFLTLIIGLFSISFAFADGGPIKITKSTAESDHFQEYRHIECRDLDGNTLDVELENSSDQTVTINSISIFTPLMTVDDITYLGAVGEMITLTPGQTILIHVTYNSNWYPNYNGTEPAETILDIEVLGFDQLTITLFSPFCEAVQKGNTGSTFGFGGRQAETTQPKYDVVEANVFPNPVSDKTQLNYTLIDDSDVMITLLNSLGQEIKTIDTESKQAKGAYQLEIPLDELKSGLYFIRIEVNNQTLVTKFLKL